MGRLTVFFLKKIKSSSLTEVVVATTILLTVFAISIFTLNNIMQVSLRNKKNKMDFLIDKHIYLFENNQLKVPFFSQEENISIVVNKAKKNNVNWVEFTAKNTVTSTETSKRILLHKDR